MISSPRCVAAALVLLSLAGSAPGQISATPKVLDFGERGHLEEPKLVIVLENDGAKPIRIREIKPSCSCMDVRPRPPAEIPASGSLTLEVTMSSGRPMGLLDKNIAVSTEDNREFRIPVRMRVHADFLMEPGDIRFESVFGEADARSVEVRRRAPGPDFKLEVEGVVEATSATGAARRNAHIAARLVEADGKKKIEVTVLPTHPEGPVRGNVEARLEGKRLIVPLAGEVFRWIKISPREHNFSRVAVSEPATLEKEITLRSTDGRPFRVLEMKPTHHRALPDGVSMEFRDESGTGPAVEHRIRAHIQVKEGASPSGSFSGKLAIRTDHPEKPEVTSSFFGFFDERRR